MPFGQGNPIYANQRNHIPPQNPQWTPPSNQGPREQLRHNHHHSNQGPREHLRHGSSGSWGLPSLFSWGRRPTPPPVVILNQPDPYGNPPAYIFVPPAGNFNGHYVVPVPHAGHDNRIFNLFMAVFIAVPIMAIAKLPPVFIFGVATYIIIRMAQISNDHLNRGCQGC